jgi:hypothetical protein
MNKGENKMSEFTAFNKIGRWSREIIVTEKIDGTNGCICIDETGTAMQVGSRTRWLSEHEDNYGFYKWAMANRDELLTLGPGRHFGEYWGQGIQRNYGLKEKRFSLFNVSRWCLHGQTPEVIPCGDPRQPVKFQQVLPPCVGLVPIVWHGNMDALYVDQLIDNMKRFGSFAAPGFMNPEGVVIFHTANGAMFKKTIEKDDEPKGKSK